ncbi:hypothetical protein HDU93_007575 [Gonapodya sp. JEL0774]|nr:hypothetical protein HDU93_007575 [Gonapodya sp. JEL0774]
MMSATTEPPVTVVEKPFVNPKFLLYWPNSSEQARRALIVQERFRIWGTILEEVVTSLTTIQEAETRLGKEYARLASVFTPTVDEIAGTESNINAVALTLSEYSAQYQIIVKVEDESLKKIKLLRDRVMNDGKKFKKAYDKLYAPADKARVETLDAISKYESAQSKRAASRFMTSADPFLSSQVLSNVIRGMVDIENEYRKGTAELFVQAAESDRRLVEDLCNAWREHASCVRAFHQAMTQQTIVFTTFLDQMKSSSPFSEFSRRHDIVASEKFAVPLSVDTFSYEVEHPGVVKEGLVFRQGGFFRNSWKPVWAVLTLTKPETLVSIQLRKPRVFVDLPGVTQSAANMNGPIFEIVEISGSKSLLGGSSSSLPEAADDKTATAMSSGTETRYLLKTNREDEMVDWVVALRRALEETPIETAPTPLLRHPVELKREVDEQLRKPVSPIRPSPREERTHVRPPSEVSDTTSEPASPSDARGRGPDQLAKLARTERSNSPKKKVAVPSFSNPWA